MLCILDISLLVQVDGGATPGGWAGGETPGLGATPKKQRSRWDETPMGVASSATPMLGATPMMGATPGATPLMTPGMAAGMETPSPSSMQAGVGFATYVCLFVAVVHLVPCTLTPQNSNCSGAFFVLWSQCRAA